MRKLVLFTGLLVASVGAAKGPDDFSRQWTVLGDCTSPSATPRVAPSRPAACEGAFAVLLDESVYRQVTRKQLEDVAAFNASGEALPFGPMPADYVVQRGTWQDAAWFALPANPVGAAQDLHLHVTRSTAGDLSLDATLRRGIGDALQDVLIDVRAPRREVDAIALELSMDAQDFSTTVSVEASDDLQHWRVIVPAAAVAQLRQGGQALVRRHIEFAPVSAKFLRLRAVGATGGLPLRSIRLQLHPLSPSSDSIERNSLLADFVRREGRAFIYRLPARVPVERVNVRLEDDNAIANFSVSARDEGERNWRYVGQLGAFRLRGAGVALDNEAMDIATMREQEWRIEASIDLARSPRLELSYRPERWLLLTHGKPPFVVAAGSRSVQRGDFPLGALVGTVRARYGRGWQPTPAALGPMQMAGGDDALTAFDPQRKRTWVLWSVLVLGAVVIVVMVLSLLKAPREP